METKALLLCLSADLPHATWGQGVELAQEWRGAGYAVKAVFIGPEGGRPSFGRPGDIGLEGIEVLPWAPPPVGLWCSPSMRESYGLYSWLRAGAGGVAGAEAIVCPLAGGLGYYASLPDALGGARPRIICLAGEPGAMARQREGRLPCEPHELERDYMERGFWEQADVVVCDCPEVLEWTAQRGWRAKRLADLGRFPAILAEPPAVLASPSATELPKVTVCITHRNRPRELLQAVDSVKAQDYPSFEVVVVDDGSDTPGVEALLQDLEVDFRPRGWTVLRQANRYCGAARNTALHFSRAKYLLFLDDDDIAKPQLVGGLVKVAEASGQDIVTCCADRFEGADAPTPETVVTGRHVPLGASPAVGVFWNCFGTITSLYRREFLLQLGGFREDYGVGANDYELFARAVLSGGRLLPVPEALFWYRASPSSILRSTKYYANAMQMLRPYMARTDPALKELLPLLRGMADKAAADAVEMRRLRQEGLRLEAMRGDPLVAAYWRLRSWLGRRMKGRRGG